MQLIFILLLILAIRFLIVFMKTVGFTTVKILVFGFDGFLVFCLTWFIYHKFTHFIAKGWAIWFWDIVIALGCVVAYYYFIVKLYEQYPKIVDISNRVFSFLSTWFMYNLAVKIVTHKYYIPFIKIGFLNYILNLVIIFYLSKFVYRKRLEVLNNQIDIPMNFK